MFCFLTVWTLLLLGAYFWLEEHKYYIVDYLHWVPILAALFYVLGFSFGFGPVPWLMMGEILPLSIRGFAAGMLSSYNWLCSYIVQLFFLQLIGIQRGGGCLRVVYSMYLPCRFH